MKMNEKLKGELKGKLKDIIDIIQTPFTYINDVYRDIKYGIKNFWYYRKVIYNDRWYDHFFLLEMMEVKLRNMVDNWDKAHYANSEVEKLQMEKAISLLKQLKDDNFLDIQMKLMDERYGELELNLDDSDNTALFTRNGKVETPEQEEDWKICYTWAEEEKQRTKDKFFKLFAENFEKWWD